MSGKKERREGELRSLKALAVVCALVLAVPATDSVVRFASGGQTASASVAGARGIQSAELLDAADAQGSLDRVEALLQEAGPSLPEAFYQEVGMLNGARGVRVSSRGDVVGYLVSGRDAEVFQEVSAHMEAKGWTGVSLGGAQGATFVKPEGEYTWLLVTCTQVGESTAVVTRAVTP